MNRSPIIRSLVQALLGAQLVIGTQPLYKAPGELRVEIKKKDHDNRFYKVEIRNNRFYKVEIRKVISIPTQKKHYCDKNEFLFC